MIASWILYAIVVSALFGGAAAALERVARLWHGPVRWSWMLALALSVAAPVVVALVPRGPEPAFTLHLTDAGRAASAASAGAVARQSALLPPLERLDGPLIALWALLSLTVLVAFGRAALAVRRARHGWRTAEVDGTSILLAPDVGPAVVGFARPRIVVPEWAFAADARVLDLMLRHEIEHIRARDPLTLLCAGLALLIAPWNVALWWQVRRLRLAVELDCDRRVLTATERCGAPVGAREYAALLVDVGERATATSTPLAWSPAFSESPSFLERRIVAMSDPSLRNRAARAAGLAAVVAIIAAVACEAPRPDPLAPQQGNTTSGSLLLKQKTEADALDQHVRALVSQYFPEALTGAADPRPMMFVLSSDDVVLATARGASVAGAKYRVAARGELRESRVDESSGVIRQRTSAGEPQLGQDAVFNRIDPATIQSVDVRKFEAGKFTPRESAAIIVRLKPGATLK